MGFHNCCFPTVRPLDSEIWPQLAGTSTIFHVGTRAGIRKPRIHVWSHPIWSPIFDFVVTYSLNIVRAYIDLPQLALNNLVQF